MNYWTLDKQDENYLEEVNEEVGRQTQFTFIEIVSCFKDVTNSKIREVTVDEECKIWDHDNSIAENIAKLGLEKLVVSGYNYEN